MTGQKLNLGCGHIHLLGYENVDKYEPADIVGDVRELEFSDVAEIVMYHLLEHISWRETIPLLARIRGWMKPGGKIIVEVPDMEVLMANPRPGSWVTDIYGSQDHEGEFHRCGFTHRELREVLVHAGFGDIHTRTFTSTHPHRPGMPCLEATGRA